MPAVCSPRRVSAMPSPMTGGEMPRYTTVKKLESTGDCTGRERRRGGSRPGHSQPSRDGSLNRRGRREFGIPASASRRVPASRSQQAGIRWVPTAPSTDCGWPRCPDPGASAKVLSFTHPADERECHDCHHAVLPALTSRDLDGCVRRLHLLAPGERVDPPRPGRRRTCHGPRGCSSHATTGADGCAVPAAPGRLTGAVSPPVVPPVRPRGDRPHGERS